MLSMLTSPAFRPDPMVVRVWLKRGGAERAGEFVGLGAVKVITEQSAQIALSIDSS
jgi:hypothetical protein